MGVKAATTRSKAERLGRLCQRFGDPLGLVNDRDALIEHMGDIRALVAGVDLSDDESLTAFWIGYYRGVPRPYQVAP